MDMIGWEGSFWGWGGDTYSRKGRGAGCLFRLGSGVGRGVGLWSNYFIAMCVQGWL